MPIMDVGMVGVTGALDGKAFVTATSPRDAFESEGFESSLDEVVIEGDPVILLVMGLYRIL